MSYLCHTGVVLAVSYYNFSKIPRHRIVLVLLSVLIPVSVSVFVLPCRLVYCRLFKNLLDRPMTGCSDPYIEDFNYPSCFLELV